MTDQEKKWYQKVPNSYVLVFFIIVLMAALTHIIPAVSFEYIEVGGRMVAQPGTFDYVQRSPVGIMATM